MRISSSQQQRGLIHKTNTKLLIFVFRSITTTSWLNDPIVRSLVINGLHVCNGIHNCGGILYGSSTESSDTYSKELR